MGEGGGFSWGGVEGWGQKAHNCNGITIKIKIKKKRNKKSSADFCSLMWEEHCKFTSLIRSCSLRSRHHTRLSYHSTEMSGSVRTFLTLSTKRRSPSRTVNKGSHFPVRVYFRIPTNFHNIAEACYKLI